MLSQAADNDEVCCIFETGKGSLLQCCIRKRRIDVVIPDWRTVLRTYRSVWSEARLWETEFSVMPPLNRR